MLERMISLWGWSWIRRQNRKDKQSITRNVLKETAMLNLVCHNPSINALWSLNQKLWMWSSKQIIVSRRLHPQALKYPHRGLCYSSSPDWLEIAIRCYVYVHVDHCRRVGEFRFLWHGNSCYVSLMGTSTMHKGRCKPMNAWHPISSYPMTDNQINLNHLL